MRSDNFSLLHLPKGSIRGQYKGVSANGFVPLAAATKNIEYFSVQAQQLMKRFLSGQASHHSSATSPSPDPREAEPMRDEPGVQDDAAKQDQQDEQDAAGLVSALPSISPEESKPHAKERMTRPEFAKANAKQRHGRIDLALRHGQARRPAVASVHLPVSGAANGGRPEQGAARSFPVEERLFQNTPETDGDGDCHRDRVAELAECRMGLEAGGGPRKRLVFDDFVVQSATRPCVVR